MNDCTRRCSVRYKKIKAENAALTAQVEKMREALKKILYCHEQGGVPDTKTSNWADDIVEANRTWSGESTHEMLNRIACDTAKAAAIRSAAPEKKS